MVLLYQIRNLYDSADYIRGSLKTKTGRLYNISFKFDDQTRAGEYGADFKGAIKLAQFIDLNTGEWIK